jgi:hypothetical protein
VYLIQEQGPAESKLSKNSSLRDLKREHFLLESLHASPRR